MNGGIIALLAGTVGLISLLVKTFFTDEAATQARELKFQNDEKVHQDALGAQAQAQQAQAPTLSAGAATAWDAADGGSSS